MPYRRKRFPALLLVFLIFGPDALPGLVDEPPEDDVDDAEEEEEERRVDIVVGQVHQGHLYHHHQTWQNSFFEIENEIIALCAFSIWAISAIFR